MEVKVHLGVSKRFLQANSADPDQKLTYSCIHGLHRLGKVMFNIKRVKVVNQLAKVA